MQLLAKITKKRKGTNQCYICTVHNIKSISICDAYTVSRISSLPIQLLVYYSENVLRPLKKISDTQNSQRGGLETVIERQLPLTNSNDPEKKNIYHLQVSKDISPLIGDVI